MLRHAEDKDRPALFAYLEREPEFNLFILGDIASFGLRSDIIDVFVQEKKGNCEAVLLRYRNCMVPYTRDLDVDLSPVVERMNMYLGQGGEWPVSGKKDIVDLVKPRLAGTVSREHDEFFSVCRELRSEVPLVQLPLVQMAKADDAPDISNLLGAIAEFGGSGENPLHLREEIQAGKRAVTMVREPATGELVSVASRVAETDSSAMIIGVATKPGCRGKGYATACVYRLVNDLRQKGKSACLFFRNPAAGAIYHRLGFKDIGMWEILEFGKTP
jgi:uncharacterized protein